MANILNRMLRDCVKEIWVDNSSSTEDSESDQSELDDAVIVDYLRKKTVIHCLGDRKENDFTYINEMMLDYNLLETACAVDAPGLLEEMLDTKNVFMFGKYEFPFVVYDVTDLSPATTSDDNEPSYLEIIARYSRYRSNDVERQSSLSVNPIRLIADKYWKVAEFGVYLLMLLQLMLMLFTYYNIPTRSWLQLHFNLSSNLTENVSEAESSRVLSDL